MTIDFTVIGKKIRETRKQKDISQEQLASMIGVSGSHLRHIETGHRTPSAEMLINIAVSLDVTVDELLAGLGLPRTENTEVSDLLRDCTPYERNVFRELISFMKPVLKKAGQ